MRSSASAPSSPARPEPPSAPTSQSLARPAPSLITSAERALYEEYERERRLRLLRAIAPAFLGLATVVLVGILLLALAAPLPDETRRGLLATSALLVALLVALVAGFLALRREALTLATTLFALTASTGAIGSVALWGAYHGLDPFATLEFTPFCVAILFTGVLGSTSALVGVTLLMNIASALLLFALPSATGQREVIAGELPLLLGVTLGYQWLFAALTQSIRMAFRRTLGAMSVAYERALRLDELKGQFISNVNHELRSPLMAMQNYLETLRADYATLPPSEVAEALGQVCRIEDALVTLVQSILSTRRVDQEATAFTPEVVPVRAAIETAISLVDPHEGLPTMRAGGAASDVAVERALRLDAPEELMVWGERIRVQQILTNLLSNAVKYSPPGAPIEVSARRVEEGALRETTGRRQAISASAARLAQTAGAVVEITVRDHGHGIPPDQAPLLFNQFVRLPRDLASNVKGTGIGLYLCRVYATAMGGRIWVESSGVEGEGATFHLQLPTPPPAASGGPKARERAASAPLQAR